MTKNLIQRIAAPEDERDLTDKPTIHGERLDKMFQSQHQPQQHQPEQR